MDGWRMTDGDLRVSGMELQNHPEAEKSENIDVKAKNTNESDPERRVNGLFYDLNFSVLEGCKSTNLNSHFISAPRSSGSLSKAPGT